MKGEILIQAIIIIIIMNCCCVQLISQSEFRADKFRLEQN